MVIYNLNKLAKLRPQEADLKEYERVTQSFQGNCQMAFPLRKILPHVFETPMHLWDQKDPRDPHRNPLKNGSLSENVMKEGERVLFQPLKLKEIS